jgi:hypothetical protein
MAPVPPTPSSQHLGTPMSGDAARKKNSQGTLKVLEPSARSQWKATSPRGGHGQSRENVAQTILRSLSFFVVEGA